MTKSTPQTTASNTGVEGAPPAPPQPQRNEWRLDETGALDDVVVDDVATFRLERMDDDHVWGCVYHRDGSRTDFNLWSDGRLSLTHEHDVAPADSLPAPAPPLEPLTDDSVKFLRLLLSDCTNGANGHAWRKCRRCLAVAELEGRAPVARRLIQHAIDTLAGRAAGAGASPQAQVLEEKDDQAARGDSQ